MPPEVATRGITVILGAESFGTKKAAGERVATILSGTPVGVPLEGADLDIMLHLLLRHPRVSEKLASCVDVVVRTDPIYNGRCFFVVAKPQTSVDFSYRQCLSPATVYGRFAAACRNEVEDDVQAFKDRAFSEGMNCPINGRLLSWSDCDVDHAPPQTFAVLVRRFIDSRNVDLAAVTYLDRGIGSVFSNSGIAREWREFHNENASLRLLSKEANRLPSP